MFLNYGFGEDSWESLARRSNQSILKEISPEYSLEGLMLKPKLQYFGHLMLRADSLGKTLMLGKIEGRRRRKQQRMRRLDGITNSMDMSLSKLGDSKRQGSPVCCSPRGHSQTRLSDWTTTNHIKIPAQFSLCPEVAYYSQILLVQYELITSKSQI